MYSGVCKSCTAKNGNARDFASLGSFDDRQIKPTRSIAKWVVNLGFANSCRHKRTGEKGLSLVSHLSTITALALGMGHIR